ncbi:hypothetical protein EDB81DRAFT_848269 [Dactylonectria macrodidyma]|uniref:Arylamine N-acetyltransferase n=1 Tax=Dactylonectria macrodidyma TaxID=307937 RepID=A0A9P9IE51_9HYPO|nr:hypothetical protein EDB81DRAFT_848269 [Dactylonectria macrodidyma]
MADRLRYDDPQLEEYFDRIALPASSRICDITGLAPDAQLQFLLRLQEQQLVNVPFENLTLHYSWHRVVDTNADHVLATSYGGLTHCLNIVTVRGEPYAVDVGFGSRCPRVWIYEYRASDGVDWVPQHCFMDSEFLPEDICVMNLTPAQSPSSFFTYKVVCVMFTTGEADHEGEVTSQGNNGAIDGILVIDGNTFKVFKAEDERLEALTRYFGIVLTEENKRAISGTAGAIEP